MYINSTVQITECVHLNFCIRNVFSYNPDIWTHNQSTRSHSDYTTNVYLLYIYLYVTECLNRSVEPDH